MKELAAVHCHEINNLTHKELIFGGKLRELHEKYNIVIWPIIDIEYIARLVVLQGFKKEIPADVIPEVVESFIQSYSDQ
jgi:hypothetical protein